jgi:hypothetical protein
MGAARAAAATAVGAVAFGGWGLFVATRGAGIAGYVSEAGVAGASHGGLYRASIGAFALALALLAGAAGGVDRLVASALAAASPFAAVSGAVRCSAGCPLPPYEPATAADLAHGAASIAALLLCGLAIVLVALRVADPLLRATGTAAMVLALPLLAGAGLTLVFVGRGALAGAMERAALAAVLLWLLAFGFALTRAPTRG